MGKTFISNRYHQFAYFDEQLGHPDWPHATVLDFGGNAGNILHDPRCPIDPEKYWCVDVSPDAIELGQREFPSAHFEFYDRYSFEYNPSGSGDLPLPDFGQRFDIVLAYSVFTHTSRGEMRELVAALRSTLTDHGVLAFTFIDPDFRPPEGWARAEEAPGLDNLLWRLTESLGPGDNAEWLAAAARREPLTWASWVNHERLVIDPGDDWVDKGDEQSQYIAFCTEEHMRSIYPDAEIRPPVRPQRQSCCVLRRGGRATSRRG